MKPIKSLLFFITLLLISSCAEKSKWKPLFNGTNLSGWTQVQGEAPYTIEDGAIVGTAVKNTPNSFLATDQSYSDFILELEIFWDSDMNSGVQIRSNQDPDYRNGNVHGYQIELDPSDRGFSGGVYDEQRRMWLYPVSRNPQAKGAMKRGEWNTYRIEAIGNSINTWINGIQCARLVDDMTSSGFIALQVHSIGNNSGLEGTQVRWRNIRILTEDLESNRKPVDESVPQISYLDNELTEWEINQGYEFLLGNGLDAMETQGELTYNEGILSFESRGTLTTNRDFGNFILDLEFSIPDSTRGGISYYVGERSLTTYNIVDDRAFSSESGETESLASLAGLIPAANYSVEGRSKQYKGNGNWNQLRIVARNGSVEHWLNNEKAVDYDLGSESFRELMPEIGDFVPQANGKIRFEGDSGFRFKNIKIKEL